MAAESKPLKQSAPKIFSEQAKQAAAAAQVHLDILQAQQKGQMAMQKAQLKAKTSQMSFAGQQADAGLQARMDAIATQRAQADEQPVGPDINVAPLPNASQPSQGMGTGGVDLNALLQQPGAVAGGAGIQQATGGAGRAQPPSPQAPPTQVAPNRLQNYTQTRETQIVPAQGGGGFSMVPTTRTSAQDIDNRLTGAQAATLNQSSFFEQARLKQSERAANIIAARGAIETYGAAGAELAGKLAQGGELTADDFKTAGETLTDKTTRAQIAASGAATASSLQQTEYYKQRLESDKAAAARADEMFKLQKMEITARLAETLGGTGGAVNAQNYPLNSAMGVTAAQAGGQKAPDNLDRALGEFGQIFKGSTGEGLARVAETKIGGGDMIDPLDFFLRAGAPAAAQNKIVVRQVESPGIGYKILGINKTPTGFTTVPFETFMAEYELAHGKVPTAQSDRIAEAKRRLKDWGYFDAEDKEGQKPFNRFMRYYWTKVESAIPEYRNTVVGRNALSSLGIIDRTPDENLRPTPEVRAGRARTEGSRQERARTMLDNFKALEDLQKSLLEEQNADRPK